MNLSSPWTLYHLYFAVGKGSQPRIQVVKGGRVDLKESWARKGGLGGILGQRGDLEAREGTPGVKGTRRSEVGQEE